MPPATNEKQFQKRVRLERRRLRKLLKARRRRRCARRRGSFRQCPPLLVVKAIKPVSSHFELQETSFNYSVPPRLDFANDAEDTLRFFDKLRILLSARTWRAVHLDHSKCEYISPEAVLVLIAELYRGDKFNPKLKKLCTFPQRNEIRELLQQIGYFRYFRGEVPTTQGSLKQHFLSHMHGKLTKGSTVKSLLDHFSEVFDFTVQSKALLYNALIECMNNVLEHAYPNRKTDEFSYVEWWLLGYRDSTTGDIYFCFFDQGECIPKTIRTRLKDKIRSGSALIRQAVEEGVSRTKKNTRGRGLPSLKKFVDEAIDGDLSIVSHKNQCIFHKGREPRESTFNSVLRGTLITWNIRGAIKNT